MRAVMEGLALAARDCYAAMGALRGTCESRVARRAAVRSVPSLALRSGRTFASAAGRGRRGRCGDDCRGRYRPVSGHGGLCR